MSPLIANHTGQYRQIRLNADYTVADVFSIRRTNREDDLDYQTTYQDPSEGAYTLTCLKGSQMIRVVDLKNQCTLQADEVETFLKRVPAIINEWLLDITTMRHSNFIPPGYGWDGKFTRAEYQKRQRANLIFIPTRYAASSNIDKQWLDVILDEICRTPKSFLQLKWHDAKAMPPDRVISYDDGFVKKEVIFIYDNGNYELQKMKRVVGDVNRHPGMKIPNNVERVILLTRGVTCDEQGNLVGCAVELLVEDYNNVKKWDVK